MAWFTRKKRKTHRKPAKHVVKASRAWDPARTLLRLKILGVVGLVLLVGFSWRWGGGALRGYVSAKARVDLTVDRVHLVGVPEWMDVMLRRDLRAIVAMQVSGDPMDQASLGRAVRVLGANPWVARVQQIRRIPGGHVRVHAVYRDPVALVQARDGYHLVAEGGVRLPGLYLEHQLPQMDLPLITGVAGAPPVAGRRWQGKDLGAGLRLARLLAGRGYLDQVYAFDVSTRDARGRIHLVLRTHTGGAVRWGLPPGDEQPIEAGATTKMMRIATLQQRFGSIDAGGKVVDIYGPAVFVHQPTVVGSDTRTAQRSAR